MLSQVKNRIVSSFAIILRGSVVLTDSAVWVHAVSVFRADFRGVSLEGCAGHKAWCKRSALGFKGPPFCLVLSSGGHGEDHE